jgi:hypothetical protein
MNDSMNISENQVEILLKLLYKFSEAFATKYISTGAYKKTCYRTNQDNKEKETHIFTMSYT